MTRIRFFCTPVIGHGTSAALIPASLDIRRKTQIKVRGIFELHRHDAFSHAHALHRPPTTMMMDRASRWIIRRRGVSIMRPICLFRVSRAPHEFALAFSSRWSPRWARSAARNGRMKREQVTFRKAGPGISILYNDHR